MQGREKKKGGRGKRKRRNPLHCPHEEAHSTDTWGGGIGGGDWTPEISDYADWASRPKISFDHQLFFLFLFGKTCPATCKTF